MANLIEYKALHFLFNFEEKLDRDTWPMLVDIYHKCSPAIIPGLIEQLKCNYTSINS